MTQENFPIGSVVRLKSGGPAMTVHLHTKHSISDNVICKWFDGNNVKTEEFKILTLEPCPAPPLPAPAALPPPGP